MVVQHGIKLTVFSLLYTGMVPVRKVPFENVKDEQKWLKIFKEKFLLRLTFQKVLN